MYQKQKIVADHEYGKDYAKVNMQEPEALAAPGKKVSETLILKYPERGQLFRISDPSLLDKIQCSCA